MMKNHPTGAPSRDTPCSVDATPSSESNMAKDVTTIPSCTCQARSQLFQMASDVGNLTTKIQQFAPFDGREGTFWATDSEGRNEIHDALCRLFRSLINFCRICNIALAVAIVKKMELNNKKYPVEHCKGKSDKYTSYSSQTGVTKDNQCTLDSNEKILPSSSPKTIPEFIVAIRTFSLERDWSSYHQPRNLALAMIGEFGELAELFQFKGDVCIDSNVEDSENGLKHQHDMMGLKGDGWTEIEVDKVGQEIADVAIYGLRLADVIGMKDLGCSM